MKIKTFGILALLLINLLAVSGIAKADSVPVSIDRIDINGKDVDLWEGQWDDERQDWINGEIRGGLKRGETLEIDVKLRAQEDDKYISVEASIKGLNHDREDARDETDTFKVREGKTYWTSDMNNDEPLKLTLPERMDAGEYMLRIEVSNRDGWEETYNLWLDVELSQNKVLIKDVVFSPAQSVKAGRSLYVTPRIKNAGDTEEDVKVTIEIPELGISDSDYIDELEKEDTVTSKELWLRIPECAEAGEYTAIVTVDYDQMDESTSKEYKINVVASDSCMAGIPTEETGKTIVTVGSDMQDVTAGQSGVVYPITLSNTGSAAKTYSISAVAGDWAEVKVSPSVVVLSKGETKFVYVSVAADEDATAGEKTFGLEIRSGDKTLKEITLKANVLEGSNGWDKVRKGLEVALVVLVVLLVIVGLIIGFTRLKDNDDDLEQEENYY